MASKPLTNSDNKKSFFLTSVYDFALLGGATTDTYPGIVIPIGTIVKKCHIKTLTPLTSGGSATIALALTGTTAGSDIAILGATVFGHATIKSGIVDVAAIGAYEQLVEEKTFGMTIAGAALTAGKIKFRLECV